MRDTSVEKLGHVWDCSIRRRVQSLSQRMESPFETEGAGEGEISLIARVAPQAGLFGELKSTEAGVHSKKRQKKKKAHGGVRTRCILNANQALYPLSYEGT